MMKKVGFFMLPLPGEKEKLEEILNDKNCVIINRKEEINAKESLALIYIEYEDHNDETSNNEFY